MSSKITTFETLSQIVIKLFNYLWCTTRSRIMKWHKRNTHTHNIQNLMAFQPVFLQILFMSAPIVTSRTSIWTFPSVNHQMRFKVWQTRRRIWTISTSMNFTVQSIPFIGRSSLSTPFSSCKNWILYLLMLLQTKRDRKVY